MCGTCEVIKFFYHTFTISYKLGFLLGVGHPESSPVQLEFPPSNYHQYLKLQSYYLYQIIKNSYSWSIYQYSSISPLDATTSLHCH